jgi:hypothetical protein
VPAKGKAMERKSWLERYDDFLLNKLGDSLLAGVVRMLTFIPVMLPLFIVQEINSHRARKRK